MEGVACRLQPSETQIRLPYKGECKASRPPIRNFAQNGCASAAGYCLRCAAIACVLLGLVLPRAASFPGVNAVREHVTASMASRGAQSARENASGNQVRGLVRTASGSSVSVTRRVLQQQREQQTDSKSNTAAIRRSDAQVASAPPDGGHGAVLDEDNQESGATAGTSGSAAVGVSLLEQQPAGPSSNDTLLPPSPPNPPKPPKPPRPPRHPPSPPPLELKFMPDQQVTIPDKCVFILGTGRSGSTSLMDALNQIPNYFIRGEQMGGFWYLYLAFRLLIQSARRATQLHSHQRRTEERLGMRTAARLSFDTLKTIYEVNAKHKKLPWFNDMHRSRAEDAARMFYLATYGYHGLHVVSGFKEIRFVCGRAFPSPGCRYQDFDYFMRFLRLMCTDVKIFLNSRASSAQENNFKLGNMLARSGVINSTEQFAADLALTHTWFDRYVNDHPCCAFRVIMEDMFDPQKNASLARRVLRFLGEDPNVTRISFTRMPTWSDPADFSDSADNGGGGSSGPGSKRSMKPVQREPWHLRRLLQQRLVQQHEVAGAGAQAAPEWEAGALKEAEVEAGLDAELMKVSEKLAEPKLARAALAALAEAGGMLGKDEMEEVEEE